jgi:hypothetical protein
MILFSSTSGTRSAIVPGEANQVELIAHLEGCRPPIIPLAKNFQRGMAKLENQSNGAKCFLAFIRYQLHNFD